MPVPDTKSTNPKSERRNKRVIGPIIGMATLLAIGYWLIESVMHARFLGTSFSRELFTLNANFVIARIAFLGILFLCAALSVYLMRKTQREQERLALEGDIRGAAIMENIHEMILLHDRNLTALWGNKAAGDSVGLTPEELVGKHCYELWHQRNKPCDVCSVLRAMETGEPHENDNVTPDGRAFNIRGYPMRDDTGIIVGAIEVTLDITDRKRMEEALALEKEHLAVTLASIADGVIVTDTGGTITFMNQAAQKLTGWRQTEAVGQQLARVLALVNEKTNEPCDDPTELVMKAGAPASLPDGAILISRDGSKRIIADSGAPIRDPGGAIIGMILVFRDITEKHRLEEEILKSQKLESLGVIAGGIAHDFNNVLTAIIGNASLAQLSIGTDDRARSILADIEKAAMRARKLTQQLLTFSKGGAPVKKVTTLNEIVQDTIRFALSGSSVSPVFDLPADLWPVDADAEQISHAVNNIVINAREAMPQGGTITVRAENANVADGAAPGIPSRRYVKISIQDQGIGIPRGDLTKIFDPYFTTKEESHSGLGLAVAFSVIKRHGGYIVVDSEPDVATTFTIYLPAAARGAKPEERPSERARAARGQGKILVMDDEEMVRGVLGKILGSFGYEVEFAADGVEAIESYRTAFASAKPFDAVIMDLTVTGGMGGREAIELLRLVDPGAKVIVSSGYSQDPVMSDFRRYGFDGVIAKPFRADELSDLLEKILFTKRSAT